MRTDFYSMIHKALRGMLFDTAALLARTDFDDDAQACRALTSVRTMLAFLREHQEHEDQVVLPVLLAARPALAHELAGDHVGGDALHREVDVLVARTDAARLGTRGELGAALCRKVAVLLAHHLEHMEQEETAGHETLWATCTDEEIAALTAKIHAGIAPERMAEWMGLIVPTLSGAQRRQMGLQAA